MRTISLVDRLEFDFIGNVLRNSLTLGDVDNDGNFELVVGSADGNLVIFKENKKWLTIDGLDFVSCVAIGDILNQNKNCLVVITGDGWCHIYCTIIQPLSASDSSDAQHDEVDGQRFSSGSIETERSTNEDSSVTGSVDISERTVLKSIHIQRIPPNAKDILLADVDGDGAVEMVLGLTDRVVRSYRWRNKSTAEEILLENVTGELVGINKWESANQIGSVTLHTCSDGSPSILIAQPGGTFMRIICQPEELILQSLENDGASDSGSLEGSKVDYQFLGISRMRNPNISSEIVGNLKTNGSENMPYAIATLDGTVMLVKDESILWAIAFDHQIFALTKLDVTNNGTDDIIACSWDGQTYILDQNKNCVRFALDESVQAFAAGYYTIDIDNTPMVCFVYVTFHNKVYIYYNIPLKEMVCKKYVPDMGKLKDILVDEYADGDKLDSEAKRHLVEYLLYNVKQ